MNKILLLLLLLTGCYAPQTTSNHYIKVYTYKKKGVTYSIKQEYSNIITVDTIKNK